MAIEASVDPRTRTREEIPETFTWNLADIYANWDEWEAGLGDFENKLAGYAGLRGTLGPSACSRRSISRTTSGNCHTSSGITPA
jgi:hypothetical protein